MKIRRDGVVGIVARRLVALPLILVAVAAMTFFLVEMSPFDPIAAYGAGGSPLSAETAAQIERIWGLDQPAHVQFFTWLGNIVTGDLGNSRLLGGQPVASQIAARLLPSAVLVGSALVLTMVGGLVLGVAAAAWRDSWVDWLVRALSYFTVSAPSFWIGLLALWVFSVQLGWFPAAGTADLRATSMPTISLQHLILPALTLASTQVAWFAMYVRTQLLEVMRDDYVRYAESLGLTRAAILFRHALPNALLPFLTLAGSHLSELIGGAILIETVFAWPGVGNLAVQAATVVDLPLLMGITLAGSALVIVGNLAADLTYRVADPRIREATT